MSNSRYPVPAGSHRCREEIHRSRFITTLAPSPTIDAAKRMIETLRGEFPDATHHCWAYVVGPPGSSAHVGMSDDGEPHGTAGRPMLNVLSHGPAGDIVAVVTRYYGGAKLGKGGLARAYAGGVKKALVTLPLVEKVVYQQARLVCDYHAVETVKRLVGEFAVQIGEETFGAEVAMGLEVPLDVSETFAEVLSARTQGRTRLTWVDGERGSAP